MQLPLPSQMSRPAEAQPPSSTGAWGLAKQGSCSAEGCAWRAQGEGEACPRWKGTKTRLQTAAFFWILFV